MRLVKASLAWWGGWACDSKTTSRTVQLQPSLQPCPRQLHLHALPQGKGANLQSFTSWGLLRRQTPASHPMHHVAVLRHQLGPPASGWWRAMLRRHFGYDHRYTSAVGWCSAKMRWNKACAVYQLFCIYNMMSLYIEVFKKMIKEADASFQGFKSSFLSQKGNILKQNRKASSNHFHLSVQAIQPAIVQTSELGGSSEVPSWVKDPTA